MITWQPGMTLDSMEKMAILQAYRFYRSNKTATANALGISIRTLDNKLEKYASDDKKVEDTNDEQRNKRAEFLIRQRGLPQTPDGNAPTNSPVQNGSLAETGNGLEPANEAAPEPALPLPVGKEIQGMPSKGVTGSHTGRPRR